MRSLDIASFANRSNEGPLAKTNRGGVAGAGTVFLAVDFDGEELVSQVEFGDLVLFQEHGLDFDRSFCSLFEVHHRDVLNVQHHRITIAAETEVGVSQRLFEPETDQEGIHIVVPTS